MQYLKWLIKKFASDNISTTIFTGTLNKLAFIRIIMTCSSFQKLEGATPVTHKNITQSLAYNWKAIHITAVVKSMLQYNSSQLKSGKLLGYYLYGSVRNQGNANGKPTCWPSNTGARHSSVLMRLTTWNQKYIIMYDKIIFVTLWCV